MTCITATAVAVTNRQDGRARSFRDRPKSNTRLQIGEKKERQLFIPFAHSSHLALLILVLLSLPARVCLCLGATTKLPPFPRPRSAPTESEKEAVEFARRRDGRNTPHALALPLSFEAVVLVKIVRGVDACCTRVHASCVD